MVGLAEFLCMALFLCHFERASSTDKGNGICSKYNCLWKEELLSLDKHEPYEVGGIGLSYYTAIKCSYIYRHADGIKLLSLARSNYKMQSKTSKTVLR